MSLRLYYFSIFFIALISTSLLTLFLFNVNPYLAPGWIIITFYFALFIVLLCLFSLIIFKYKIWASNREVIYSYIAPTLRQSAIISLIIVGIIFFIQIEIINWWITILYVLALVMLELFFRSKK